jgi:hypothetical protein
LAEQLDALATLDLDRSDLGVEFPFCLSCAESSLGTLRPPVLSLTRDLHAGHEIPGVPSRMLTGEGVVQSVEEHAVINLGMTHAIAPAASVYQIGRAIHVLHPASDGGLGLTEPDLLRRGDDGLAPGPQTRLTVIAGTETGNPPPIAACRAGFMRIPAWMTLPMTTTSMRAPSRLGRLSVPRMAAAPSSVAGAVLSDPLYVPIAVRTGWVTMTSCICM